MALVEHHPGDASGLHPDLDQIVGVSPRVTWRRDTGWSASHTAWIFASNWMICALVRLLRVPWFTVLRSTSAQSGGLGLNPGSFPVSSGGGGEGGGSKALKSLVGVRGFEPRAPASRRRCSTRLSYTPMASRGMGRRAAYCNAVGMEHANPTLWRKRFWPSKKATVYLSADSSGIWRATNNPAGALRQVRRGVNRFEGWRVSSTCANPTSIFQPGASVATCAYRMRATA